MEDVTKLNSNASSNTQNLLQKIKNKEVKVCVVGLGYVGFPTAIYFAEAGFDVIGCDKKEDICNIINNKKEYLPELGLYNKLKELVSKDKLSATTDINKAVSSADVVLVTVPTPITSSKEPDISYVVEAGELIAKNLRKNQLIVLESTVYPGLTEEFFLRELSKSKLEVGKDYGLAYCPERYNPGDTEHTIKKTARVVGATTSEWTQVAAELYRSVIDAQIVEVSNIKTAEAAKIIENIQRDLNIALTNELSMIFDRLGVDIMEILEAAKTKWNFHSYQPGGVGGHCLPVDPFYLMHKAEELGIHARLITAGRQINDYIPHYILDLIIDGLNEAKKAIKNSKIVVLGLSYKENVADLRESPSVELIEELEKKKAKIIAVDPYIEDQSVDVFEAVQEADAVVLMTQHSQFLNLDLQKLKDLMNSDPVFVECKRKYDKNEIKRLGFIYRGLGAGNSC